MLQYQNILVLKYSSIIIPYRGNPMGFVLPRDHMMPSVSCTGLPTIVDYVVMQSKWAQCPYYMP